MFAADPLVQRARRSAAKTAADEVELELVANEQDNELGSRSETYDEPQRRVQKRRLFEGTIDF